MRSPADARRTSNTLFGAVLVLCVLWTAARIIPDDAADGWLVVRGLIQGPLFAVAVACWGLAFRHRGWADGFEAANTREEAEDA